MKPAILAVKSRWEQWRVGMHKKIIFTQFIFVLLFTSCVSSDPFVYGETINTNAETFQKLGFVETKYEYLLSSVNNEPLLERSHFELYKIAQREYGRDIEIVNIVIEKQYSYKNIFLFVPMVFGGYYAGSYLNVHAMGEVVKFD